jgi:hypothetical protein
MTDRSSLLDEVRRGMVPAHIYDDYEIFRPEKERSSVGPGLRGP